MIVGGAAYYFHVAGIPDLLLNGSNDRRGNGVTAAQVFSGVYLCDESSGCKYPIRLILEDDTTVDIIASKDGGESSLGQGSWDVNKSGGITMQIRNPLATDPNYPSSITATKVSSTKITGFSSKSLLPGMEDPVFKRTKTEAEIKAEQQAAAISSTKQTEQDQPITEEEPHP